MRVRFWGTRGSIAQPGPAAARYGGNTSCVEVRSDSGTLIVIDGGTGAHPLGQHLVAAKEDGEGHLLISHTHWDHIQGIPFFAPLFVEGNRWSVYGPKGLSQGLRATLAGQMEHAYFPIELGQFAATIEYHDLVEGTFAIGDIRIVARYLNHPALTLGYRIECDGASIAYCCDHEPHSAAMATGEEELTGMDRRYAEFVKGADLVIHDSQYIASEFAAKVGWGHSTAEYAVRVCCDGGVKRLALTHHDPLRDDDAVDRILEQVRRRVADRGSALEVVGAAEGMVLEHSGDPSARAERTPPQFEAMTALDDSALARPVFVRVDDAALSGLLREALDAEGIAHRVVAGDEDLACAARELEPTLLLVGHDPPAQDGLAIARGIRRAEKPDAVRVPIVLVTQGAEAAALEDEVATDWLVAPFSQSYARTRIRAWVLRAACRWVRARLPVDEERRVAILRELAILDTPTEDRFDRITRIAATALDVPVALVSLVDSDRQWFKSCFGIGDVRETPREMAFCAHVVHQKSEMSVPDTLLDDRFADNPLVREGPRIRAYTGIPLQLEDGSCIGTLCVADTRPRVFSEMELGTLRDLRDMAIEEILRGRTPGRVPAIAGG